MGEETIARNIYHLRKKRKITLDKLADLTGLTKGYLSKIERAKKAPPYSTLNKIAIAFGVDAGSLLEENPQGEQNTQISFTKKSKGKSIKVVGSLAEGSLYGYNYEALASDKSGKNMEPFIIEPAFDEEAIFQHEGEEFMYVLEGRHEFIYNGNRYLMEKGDSVYFDAAVPHTGKSLGKKKAKLLAVMYNYRRF
ncbi:MAG: transcriptional regulator (Cro/CI family protein) [Deltaproteobacteria bacterium]|nr:transcriptional regulator (Cro/CI family protein) [Deltaproteobacteria bacterium]